jgi:hypothetical protein
MKCCQTVSFLLIIVFLGISAGQMLHSHKSILKTEQANEDDSGYIGEKCKICEFYVHKQGKVLNLSYPPVFTAPLPEPISYTTHYYIGNYKFTLQGFSNKGPPVLVS